MFCCRTALSVLSVAVIASACAHAHKSKAAYAPYNGGPQIAEAAEESSAEYVTTTSSSDAPAPPPSAPQAIGRSPAPAKQSVPRPAATPAGGVANQATPGTPPATAAQQIATHDSKARRLIYNATLQLAVFETTKVIDAVEKLATDRGGYLVARSDNAITVRVPAKDFQRTIEDVAGLGDLIHRNVTVQDISAEFRDLEMRLKNLTAVRARLEHLLDRAANVQAALAVERELSRVAGEIEVIKGRLKLYSELVAFSTIQVTLAAQPIDRVSSVVRLPFPWLNELGLNTLLEL
ncbi:MAG TPA: DUF4349 domain-containing protein [Kofleriaceae bacterium]|nr:DUF4349 domain-containing protein [Kofleriaceae bacterium]